MKNFNKYIFLFWEVIRFPFVVAWYTLIYLWKEILKYRDSHKQ